MSTGPRAKGPNGLFLQVIFESPSLGYAPRTVAETQTGVRVELAATGAAEVATGLPVLDHLVRELAITGCLRLSLEVAPGSADAEVAAAGKGLGEALAPALRTGGAYGRGWAWLSADEAVAGAILEISDRPLVASNVDFTGQRVGGLASDVVGKFLNALVEGAGLNLHIRVLEGKDPEHVLMAIFKALGAALGQACRPAGGER
jgi:imidazoleglycerol-phosphate dehydratase